MAQGSGGGPRKQILWSWQAPGDHPGVTIVPLTSNTNSTAINLTEALSAGGKWLFNYTDAGMEFAVIVTGYQE